MADLHTRIADAPFAGAVRLEADAVVAAAKMTGAEVERIEAEGELSVDALPRVLLEVGGTVVAEGRIVRRRGESYFKVERMAGRAGKEAAK